MGKTRSCDLWFPPQPGLTHAKNFIVSVMPGWRESVEAMRIERALVHDVDSWQGNQLVVLLGHPANA